MQATDDTIITLDREPGEISFHVTSDEEREFFEQKQRRDQLVMDLKDLCDHIGPGDVFYDLGAHIGFYSCVVGVACPDAEIVCVEPHPESRARLEENLALNDIDATVKPYAIGGENRVRGLARHTCEPGGMAKFCAPDTAEETVQFRTFESLIAEDDVREPTIIKTDIEGYELPMVRTSSDILSRESLDFLNIEMHTTLITNHGGDDDEVQELLTEYGFTELCDYGLADLKTYPFYAAKSSVDSA